MKGYGPRMIMGAGIGALGELGIGKGTLWIGGWGILIGAAVGWFLALTDD